MKPMKINENKEFQRRRDKTDKSLKYERHSLADSVDKKDKAVERESDENVRLNRLAADSYRERERAKVDSDEKKYRRTLADGQFSSPQDDRGLTQERARSDKAQNVQRIEEDRARTAERFQKRLIAQALLESEHKETNANLLDERFRTDLETEQHSRLLSDEKASHHLTQTALVTRDQFLAIVSHDLKNPLSAISISAGLMRRNVSSGKSIADHLKYIEAIERNAATMDRMISDLLDVERMAHGKLILNIERGDVCALLRECRDLSASVVASKSFSITVRACPVNAFADIDHDRVLQVLSNLIGNALKFTPKGGAIKISAAVKLDEIEISVADNGPGIPEEKRAQIFERFSQLGTNDRRGLGLGLFISKWIVEAHKGRIWVSSDVGKGSTFSFSLPRVTSH